MKSKYTCHPVNQKKSIQQQSGFSYLFHWIGPGFAVNIIGGQLYRKYGRPVVLKGMSYTAGAWCVIMLIYLTCRRPVEQPLAKEAINKEGKAKEKKVDEGEKQEIGVYKEIELEGESWVEKID